MIDWTSSSSIPQVHGPAQETVAPSAFEGNVPRWPPVKQRPVISSTPNEGYRFLGRTFDHPEYWSAPSLCMSLCGAHARKNCDQHGAANLYHWAALCEVSTGLRHRGIRQVGFPLTHRVLH
ncbi:hypothetical protein CEXT_696541 [Caerostris extrusa]|uniref:Uncharacterized protein n=1 Tax=Caerostris extrusa TaxID=172846 RepID=A0AAV4PVQ2_CAEEX|nr:hypothetical protein CEXT_696541 [Caerostris extrusa]